MAPPKKLFVKTYGCQMNAHDSERMAELLAGEGYETTADPAAADLVLLNTCHIREKATEKVYSDLGRLRPLKLARPQMRIGVTGCTAQAEGEEIRRRMPMVDLVAGPQAYHLLPAMLAGTAPAVAAEFPAEDKFDHLPARRAGPGPTAFVTVQEGCDRFCAFCVVPYTRGAEVSRPAARILAEVRTLAAQGVREVTLLGQNVNAWHGERPGGGGEWSLARLIREVAGIEGIARIRYTTSHPCDMSDDLIAAHGDCPALMPWLHLPVQSGSDRVLKAMNRRHTADAYLRLVARIRAARPDIVLSSDFIVGFPGESEADFEATLALIREAGFESAFSFRYSPRPGTPAAGREAVPAAEAEARLHALQALVSAQQRRALAAMVGREAEVLYEKPGRMAGQWSGRSEQLWAVHVVDPQGRAGELVRVRVTESAPNSLAALRIG